MSATKISHVLGSMGTQLPRKEEAILQKLFSNEGLIKPNRSEIYWSNNFEKDDLKTFNDRRPSGRALHVTYRLKIP